jgi:uncharacterized repeat protein (TIGR03803 family)
VQSKRVISRLGMVLALVTFLLTGASRAWAASEKVLHNFAFARGGASPYAPLIFDGAGNLYGTTTDGGAHGYGTVFELVPEAGGWSERVLYSFRGGSDGGFPSGGLVFDSAGALYGITNFDNGSCFGTPPYCGTVFKLTPSSSDGWTESVIYSFKGGSDGVSPVGALVFDTAGNLYGATGGGGNTGCEGGGCGTIFKLTPTSGGGWTESVLYRFAGSPNGDGAGPNGSLIFDSAGALYGTTGIGGSCFTFNLGCGTVFKLTPSSGGGWTESILYRFTGGADGIFPNGSPIFDSAGNLYGATIEGGNTGCQVSGCGTVFKLTPSSGGNWTESVLYAFTGGNDQGPGTALIFDSTGNLYGTTSGGPTENPLLPCQYCGTVFELTPSSKGQWTPTVLHTFTFVQGAAPLAGLVPRNGVLYGPASLGGAGRLGVVFKLTPTSGGWTESLVHNFKAVDGRLPSPSLVADATGNLFGTTFFGGSHNLGTVFELTPGSSGGWTEKVLYNFTGGRDGGLPMPNLVFDAAGNLYGTANIGGAHQTRGTTQCFPYFGGSTSSCGVVFKLAPSTQETWTESVIYSFCPKWHCRDGRNPGAGLITDKAGHLYGVAGGGDHKHGVIFELTPSASGWTESVLHSFCGQECGDGNGGQFPLVLDGAGNLYGVNGYGGGGTCNCGLVFELMPTGSGWTLRVLHTFTGGTNDGAFPGGRLTLDSAGNVFGSTFDGGASVYGTVFEVMPQSGGGWTERLLYSFTGGADGTVPNGSLVFDSAGVLYGTTIEGGNLTDCAGSGCGTVFKLTPNSGGGWTESVLYSFTGGKDGGEPDGGLIFDSAGNLAGTTSIGGAHNAGTVFEVTP